jgi:tetratricopeptide (TPR) repeat protein
MGEERERLRGRLYLYAIFFLAALLRLLYLRELQLSDPFYDVPVVDSATYHTWAQRIANGELVGRELFYLAPGYPYLLGAIYAFLGSQFILVYLVQIAMDLGILLALRALGKRVFSEKVGLLAAFLWAFYPMAAFFACKISAETPGTFWIVMGLWLLTWAAQDKGKAKALAAGLLVGMAVLTRSFWLALLPWLAFLLLARRDGDRRPLGLTLTFFAGVGLLIAPVTMRNGLVAGEWVLVSGNSGLILYAGNNPQARGVATRIPGISQNVDEQWWDIQRYVEERLGHPVTRGEVDAYWRREVWSFIREQPRKFASLLARKFLLALSAEEHSDIYFASFEERNFTPSLRLFFVPIALVIPLGVAGMLLSRDSKPARLLMAVPATQLTILLIFSVTERYRFPAVPFLCLFASYAVIGAKKRELSRPWLWVTALLILGSTQSHRVFPLLPEGEFPPEVWYNTGYACLERGEPQRAMPFLQRALAQRPHYPEAMLNLGNALYLQGKRDEAVELWRHTLRLREDYPLALHNLAVAFRDIDPELAARYWSSYMDASRRRPEEGDRRE